MDKKLPGRIWKFAHCEFDEGQWELRCNGEPVEVETKPLEVLFFLLLHRGDTVTQDELKRAVWSGSKEPEDFQKSLFTAISRLRVAIGDSAKAIVVTVPKYGYRFAAEVTVGLKSAAPVNDFQFAAGDPVPSRINWNLTQRLGASPFNEVWMAEHTKTHEIRVFKMATDAAMLQALRREANLSRYFAEATEHSEVFVRVLDFQFETAPFLLESVYGGPDLTVWAETQGGLANVPLATRLDIMRQTARAVGIAHDLGVLHKDLKPSNVLITPDAGGWLVKVADFGSAVMLDPARLSDFGISGHGFSNQEDTTGRAGTWMYAAPEIKKKDMPTIQADIYSLGVMLYQMVIADFTRPLALGWEAGVTDPLLQEDIDKAAHGAPALRLSSAAELSDRLASIEDRRAALRIKLLHEEESRAALRKLGEARARRPLVFAVLAVLIAGLCTSLLFAFRAIHEKKNADEQAATSQAMLAFLSENLIGQSDPFHSKSADPTLRSAILQASTQIDKRFRNEPLIAAKLHRALAESFDSQTRFADAANEYNQALADFSKAGPAANQERWLTQCEFAVSNGRSMQPGDAQHAVDLTHQVERETRPPVQLPDDVRFWLLTAEGLSALSLNDGKQAVAHLQSALALAEHSPNITEHQRLLARQKLMVIELKTGNLEEAERQCKKLIADFTKANGPNSPYVLLARENLAMILYNSGHSDQALRETDDLFQKCMASLGERHAFTLQVLATRAAAEGTLGDYAHSIQDDLKLSQLAMTDPANQASRMLAIGSLSDASTSECQNGQAADGEQNARRALTMAFKEYGPKSALYNAIRYTVAACLVELHRPREADPLLSQIDPTPVALMTGFPLWRCNVLLAQAQAAFEEKRFDDSRRLAQQAAPGFSNPKDNPYQYRQLKTLEAQLHARPESGTN